MTRRFSRFPHGEQGAVLVMGAFVIAILLAVAGLAVDSGRFYHARLQLQKAADAGALSGLGATVIDFDTFSTLATVAERKQFIETKALRAATENLRVAGFDISDPKLEITPTYNFSTGTLRVDASSSQKSLLALAAPMFLLNTDSLMESTGLSVVAEVNRKPANISLVLDVSSSMECPSFGSCRCNTALRDPSESCAEEAALLGVNQKITDLSQALYQFLDLFDTVEDRINMVSFALIADLRVPLRPIDPLTGKAHRGFDRAAFNNFSSVSPGSSTNPSDGLMTAYQDFLDSGVANGPEEVSYILFSDGAPTAARFLISSPKSGMEANTSSTLGSHDYHHYSIVWQDSTVSRTWVGPSLFFKEHHTLDPKYNSAKAPVGNYTPSCHHPLVPVGSTEAPSDDTKFEAVFTDCINNFGFHMPMTPGKIYGDDMKSGTSKDFSNHWREQYFNNTIQLSDFLREKNAMVYTIGLGQQQNIAADISRGDPYQGINSVLHRKDIFLSRAASDYIEAHDELSRPYLGVHPEFSYNGYKSYEALKYSSNPKFGRYFATPNSQELTGIFKSIAQKVLLRLTK